MITTPDLINGLFELLGAYYSWRNARQLYLDRSIRGVYWPAWVFYSAWGLWNLYYYPALDQWFSAAAGAVLVAGNLAWIGVAVRFRLLGAAA